MEAIIYDNVFRKVRILDTFTSFIWNDLYIGAGDFEIEYPITDNGMAYINEGYYVVNEQSDRIMIIETINIITDFDYGNVCRISGRSLESVILRRPLRYAVAINNGRVQDLISMILNQNFINPKNPNRKIDSLIFSTSSDPEVTKELITAEYEAGGNCYDIIESICYERHLGFRITLFEERFFQFELYKGKDRSYNQNKNPWVVFSANFENLEESDMTIDTQNLKNCMEIDLTIVSTQIVDKQEVEIETLYPLTIGDDVKGMERRELYASSRQTADKIDISRFGTAAQRVNEKQYSSWMPVYFDSTSYNRDMEQYNSQIAANVSRLSQPSRKTEVYALQPGDKGYVDTSQTPGAEWINTRTRVVEESPEEVRNRVSSYLSALEDNSPKKENYYTYGWVMTDEDGYRAAIEKAQADINTEYNAAVAASINYIKAKVIQAAAEQLSEYSTITKFDGKIDPNVGFIYGEDYYLGDVVQIVNAYRFNATTRVTGVVFSQDNQNGIVARPIFESDDSAEVKFDLEDAPSGQSKSLMRKAVPFA